MGRRVALVLVVVATALAGCADTPGRVGAEGGPLPTATSPTPSVSPSAAPAPAPDPPDDSPQPQPSETDPSPSPSPSESIPPPDLVVDDPDGRFELRILGIVDPARADAINVFEARPVVVLLHASGADAELVAEVATGLDTDAAGSVEPAVGTTLECPRSVVDAVVLRPGQGQRLCVNFDLPGAAEVTAVTVAVGAHEARREAATVPAADPAILPSLGVGAPEDAVPLGEAVDVALAGPGAMPATASLAVDEVRPVEGAQPPSGRQLVAVEMTVAGSAGDSGETLDVPSGALAAISSDGTQWVAPVGARVPDCRGLEVVPPSDEPLERCVTFLVREGDVVSHVRFVGSDGAIIVWQVLEQGGVGGPGSNA